MWKIAIYGTNNMYKPDSNSMLELTVIDGTTNPMTDNRWLKLDVLAINPHWETIGDIEVGNGGTAIHPHIQVRTFRIELMPFKFPDDMHKIEALAGVLNKRRVFVYQGEYPSTEQWSLHPAGMALCVALKIKTEDVAEDGTKEIQLEGRCVKVMR